MTFSRRHFIGTLAAGSLGLVAPRSFASASFASGRSGGVTALLPQALAALKNHASSIRHRDLIGIVDFAAPSHVPRFHLVDVGQRRVVTSLLVAHGRGSDPANSGWVAKLSNKAGSNASCEGSFVTSDTYVGKHGLSRRLIGLEAENSLAESRGIVVHAASYVDPRMAASQGRIGRSLGCFAVSQADIGDVLARLGTGRLIFASK